MMSLISQSRVSGESWVVAQQMRTSLTSFDMFTSALAGRPFPTPFSRMQASTCLKVEQIHGYLYAISQTCAEISSKVNGSNYLAASSSTCLMSDPLMKLVCVIYTVSTTLSLLIRFPLCLLAILRSCFFSDLELSLIAVMADLVKNYAPHIKPDVESAPPTAELRRILCTTAEDMLASYLRKYRTRRLVARSGAKANDSHVNAVSYELNFKIPLV